MSFTFLPDLFAFGMVLSILLLVRRKYSDERTDAWLLGLLITLVETIAHAFNGVWPNPAALVHITVLNSYILAGLVFLWASRDAAIPRAAGLLSLTLNGIPLVAFGLSYGLNPRAPQYCAVIALLGAFTGVTTSLVFYGRRLLAMLLGAGWIAVTGLVYAGLYQHAMYWAVGSVYAAAAWNFYNRLERGNTGRLAIVTGFSVWALFFFVHPWMQFQTTFGTVSVHFWNLQKLLISIGLILVMLEEKASTHSYLAHHDDLTGLPNRRMFAARLSSAVEMADRRNSSLAVIVLDLDGFKAINDSQGHSAGDYVLREVAAMLRSNVRVTDMVARMGGDEFIILADGLTSDVAAWRLAEAVRSAVSGPIQYHGARLDVSASVGVARYPEDAADPIKLLRLADQRMYGLKKRPAEVRPIDAGRSALPAG